MISRKTCEHFTVKSLSPDNYTYTYAHICQNLSASGPVV